LFGSFFIHGGLHLNFTYLPETVNAYIKEAVDECAVARTMSFIDGGTCIGPESAEGLLLNIGGTRTALG